MLSDNIRKFRKESNMSQDELGEKLGVSRQSISLWETGQTQPTIENIVALAKVFDVSTDAILDNAEGVSAKTGAGNTAAEKPLEKPWNDGENANETTDGTGETESREVRESQKTKKQKKLYLLAAGIGAVILLGAVSAFAFGCNRKKPDSERTDAEKNGILTEAGNEDEGKTEDKDQTENKDGIGAADKSENEKGAEGQSPTDGTEPEEKTDAPADSQSGVKTPPESKPDAPKTPTNASSETNPNPNANTNAGGTHTDKTPQPGSTESGNPVTENPSDGAGETKNPAAEPAKEDPKDSSKEENNAETAVPEKEPFDLFTACKDFAVEKGSLNGDYCIYQQPASLYGGYDDEYFSISYWSGSDMVEFCLHCPLSETFSINFYLRMRGGYDHKYEYLSSRYYRDNGESLRDASGYIDPAVFSDRYPLSFDEYNGSIDGQTDFMEESRVGICDLIYCLKNFVETENMGFDFSAFEFVNF